MLGSKNSSSSWLSMSEISSASSSGDGEAGTFKVDIAAGGTKISGRGGAACLDWGLVWGQAPLAPQSAMEVRKLLFGVASRCKELLSYEGCPVFWRRSPVLFSFSDLKLPLLDIVPYFSILRLDHFLVCAKSFRAISL